MKDVNLIRPPTRRQRTAPHRRASGAFASGAATTISLYHGPTRRSLVSSRQRAWIMPDRAAFRNRRSAPAVERLNYPHRCGETRKLWTRAADVGTTYAILRITNFYPCASRFSESEQWMRRAAHAGHPEAITRLAAIRKRSGRPPEAQQWADVKTRNSYQTKKLFIGSLSFASTDAGLASYFSQFGDIISAKIIMDRDSGRSKGFGFVEMERNAADRAIRVAHNAELDSRRLIVNEAKPMPERAPRRFRY
jgi:RNA recognition motif. (a.k.a. RRM, RBD, or RNP domain)